MTPYFELEKIAVELTTRYNCVLYGSLGLQLTYPEVLDTPPHDADFITRYDRENLKAIIKYLQQNGYQVYSWEDPIVDGFDMNILTGRIYIRGIKHIDGYSPAIIDITYELIPFPIENLLSLSKMKGGIKILNKEGYIIVLDFCEKEKHKQERRRLMEL